jgi:hypothetical protein
MPEPAQVKHLAGAPFLNSFLALPTNIRLCWKGLSGANALAYYETLENYSRKMFYRLGPDTSEHKSELTSSSNQDLF